MAQLVARLVRNEKVGGSNPPSSTTSEGLSRQEAGGADLFRRSHRHGWRCPAVRCRWAVVQNFDLVSCRGFESGVVIEEYIRTIR